MGAISQPALAAIGEKNSYFFNNRNKVEKSSPSTLSRVL